MPWTVGWIDWLSGMFPRFRMQIVPMKKLEIEAFFLWAEFYALWVKAFKSEIFGFTADLVCVEESESGEVT